MYTSLKLVIKFKCVTQFHVHIFMVRCASRGGKNVHAVFLICCWKIRIEMCLCEWGAKAASASKPQLYSSFSQFQYEIVCESLIAFYNEFSSSTDFFSLCVSLSLACVFCCCCSLLLLVFSGLIM